MGVTGMKRMAGLLLLACASPTIAGVYTDDLTKCVVKKATPQDKSDLVRWMFGAVSLNPDLKELVTVTAAQRETFNGKFANIIERLLLTDCRPEAVDAVKYEGTAAFGESFRVLGDVAGRSMMNSPASAAAMGSFTTLLHKDQWDKFTAESGVDVMGADKGK